MSTINYGAMTNQELKRYMLDHRDDVEAFHTYIDRRHARPNRQVIRPDDPNWEEKVKTAILRQLSGREGASNQ